jgi:hypothetical protein
VNELYAPLIERELDAFPAAVESFLRTHSLEDLWVAVARFAVLAYAPSQHAKRAVMAVRAAHDLRASVGDSWRELIIECGRYAAASRQPWSEPPILEPPAVDPAHVYDRAFLQSAIAAKDRLRAEQWLAARGANADSDLRVLAEGDALLMTDAVLALAPLLGDKGRYALLRVAVSEMLANNEREELASLDVLIEDVARSRGSVESVRRVLLWIAGESRTPSSNATRGLTPYPLARDYAQTLLAHAAARYLPLQHVEPFLAAVHDNLENGESFEAWSFA